MRGCQVRAPHPSPLTPHPSPLTSHPSPLAPHPSPIMLPSGQVERTVVDPEEWAKGLDLKLPKDGAYADICSRSS